ncbi:MAG: extracellular solute-binding protein [Chloroflexi bacterium]|nr:extracellular solute-binding protein [Chloroflexota bacterium]
MSSKLTRREFLRDSGFLAAAVALASCTPAPGPEPTSSPAEGAATSAPAEGAATSAPDTSEPTEAPVPTTATPAEEEIALRMAFWDAWALDAYEHEAALFNEMYPNVNVAVEMTSFGEYNPKLTASMAGGVPPDVAGVINLFFTSLASTGSMLSLMPYIEGDQYDLNDWLEGNLQDGMWLGDLLAIPFTADGLWWFYNADTFAAEGLDTPYDLWKAGRWDWDTYLDLAAKLTKGEGLEKQWGTESITPDYDFKFYPLIWQNGGDLFDSEYTKCILNEEEAVQAFEFAYACQAYAPAPEDSQTGTHESGRVAMFAEWELYNAFYPGEVPFEWGCAPPPASPDTGEIMFCGDAPGFGIPRGVKYADMSWEFIKFLMTPDSLLRLFHAIAAPPPRVSMFETPVIFEEHPNYGLDAQVAWEISQARLGSFKNTPKVSTYAEMKTAMSEEMSLVWAGTMDLNEGIEKVTQAWTDLVQGATIDPDVGCAGKFC